MNAKNESKGKVHPLTWVGSAFCLITGIGVIRFAVTVQHASQSTAHVCALLGGAILGICILIPVVDYLYSQDRA